jgi:hypothetical protein
MLRDVNVQDAAPIMTDDEKAVEHAERNRWHRKKSIAAIASRWFLRKAPQRLAGSESLGACFIQQEIVRSEMSKPSMSSSPWMGGAPQVVFSATIRKINCRTCFGVCLSADRLLHFRNQSPIQSEAGLVPPDHRFRRDDDEGFFPL